MKKEKLRVLHAVYCLGRGGAEKLAIDITRELNKRDDVEAMLISFDKTVDYEYDVSDMNYRFCPAKIRLSLYKKNKISAENYLDVINNFKPHIIHTHRYLSEIITRYYPTNEITYFTHCHDNMIQFENFSWKTIFSKRKLLNFYEKKYLFHLYKKSGGTQFVASSNDTKKYFEKTAPRYPVTLLHNAIDYNKFYKNRDSNVHGDKIRIVNVGSFVEKKNQKFLLDIAKILKDKNIDFELHLLGDGDDRPILEEKTNILELNERVFFHGNVTNVEEFLWTYDIYLHSATYEPLGLVLLEAMAAGLPVITLDGRGNRDLIEQGKNGFMLFEPNAEEFARKIIELWNDQAKYREISLYSQDFAGNFDIKEYVDRLINIYHSTYPNK